MTAIEIAKKIDELLKIAEEAGIKIEVDGELEMGDKVNSAYSLGYNDTIYIY